MALHTFFRSVVATGLLSAGLAAHAGTVTFNNWFHGNSNTASVAPAFNGHANFNAGAFKVTLSNFGGANAAFNGKSFEAYCVELTEYFSPGSSYNTYELLTAADYFVSKPGVADKLTQLVSYVNNNGLFSVGGVDADLQSTALQMAIWNTVYDTDSTLTASQGALFSEGGGSVLRTTGASFRGSNDLLASAGTSSGYSLYVLKSGPPGQQDQLIWLRNDVPEPASLALVALALCGAGFASRRRG